MLDVTDFPKLARTVRPADYDGDNRERLTCPDWIVNYENPRSSLVRSAHGIAGCYYAAEQLIRGAGFGRSPAGFMELNETAEAGTARSKRRKPAPTSISMA